MIRFYTHKIQKKLQIICKNTVFNKLLDTRSIYFKKINCSSIHRKVENGIKRTEYFTPVCLELKLIFQAHLWYACTALNGCCT